MNDLNTGVATEVSPPSIEQGNATIFAASFDEAKSGAREGFLENDGSITLREPEPKEPAKPATAKVETKAAPTPTTESEFPTELMTGEKPAAEAVKDELDDIQPSAKMGQESRTNFDKLKALAREARTEAARIKAEYEALKAKPAVASETEELKSARAQLKEYEERVERADFTQSPKYQAIVTERDQAVEDAKAYVAGTEIDPAVIEMAAHLTGPKRVAALRDAGIDAETIAAITPFLAHADRKERERSQALEKSGALRAEWDAQSKQQQEALKQRERAEEDRIYDATGAEVAKAFEPFQIIPGADKWNAQVETLKSEAKEFFNGSMPIEKMAEIAYYGVGAKVMHKMFHAQRAEVKALKEQLGKLQAAQPANGSSNGHATANAAPTTYEELSRQRASGFDAIMGRG